MFSVRRHRPLLKACHRRISFSTAAQTQYANAEHDLKLTSSHVHSFDSELSDILRHEHDRQRDSIALIPSENYTSHSVLQGLGSVMHNNNYYDANSAIIDICKQRALDAYSVGANKHCAEHGTWDCNIESISGSPVNFYVYSALLNPGDRIMSLDLPHGGHLSHGYQTPTKKISAVSAYWEVLPYRLNEQTGIIDYDAMEYLATLYRPKMIVSGASAYSRHFDFDRIRQICDKVNAIMLFDMAHISGLIAGQAHPSPFAYADVVTTTTHKSLRGPRAAMVFFRTGVKGQDKKGADVMYAFGDKINESVSIRHQRAPCYHTITALSTALKQAQSAEFAAYQQRVVENSKAFVAELQRVGYDIVSNGTDNHLALINLHSQKIGGAQVEKVCELSNIALNKNTVPGDKSAMNPGGIRVGSPAMTTRGCLVDDFQQIAAFIDDAVRIALDVQSQIGSNKMKDFKTAIESGEVAQTQIQALKENVVAFARQFPLIGVD
mmetsp:Transcript_25108/g.40760  ORF Transcript_25108/g.40760 Transcript_25108/m.40760 type:complete len:493 (-) Transcript_25108:413-1891(-)|eukprot:CAMPEP_0202693388 /NCGR_PEP_ID=MMETSP1385-20130828/7522_1 /ASSEMBLY_ACC=CAM_ASM_000861 /TAXON_ID=933848 /ORGANISM="Elphidium margaritaceum" /LENGTH=492 /DNA_ID=CAMNT_0049349061 /DNA_START=48 /DNA_END=1526 /DNA_ORIENTATION=-